MRGAACVRCGWSKTTHNEYVATFMNTAGELTACPGYVPRASFWMRVLTRILG